MTTPRFVGRSLTLQAITGWLNEEDDEQFSQRLCVPGHRQGCGVEACLSIPPTGSTRSWSSSECLVGVRIRCRDRSRDRAIHRRVIFVEWRFGSIRRWCNRRHGNHGGERKDKRPHGSLKKHNAPIGV